MISIKRVCEDYAAECGPRFWSNFGENRLGFAKNPGEFAYKHFFAKNKDNGVGWNFE